jgi:hypothetical protein
MEGLLRSDFWFASLLSLFLIVKADQHGACQTSYVENLSK